MHQLVKGINVVLDAVVVMIEEAEAELEAIVDHVVVAVQNGFVQNSIRR
jgi:ribosomal silencing factor RsfS